MGLILEARGSTILINVLMAMPKKKKHFFFTLKLRGKFASLASFTLTTMVGHSYDEDKY